MSPMADKIVIVVGACGLDRSLSVSSYPLADSKIRTESYHENGGGNAANTAHAMARLRDARVFSPTDVNSGKGSRTSIRLSTKVGGDSIGTKLFHELKDAGVEVETPLFCIGGNDSTSSITTIIVSETEKTRTCFHTPGSCGDLTSDDLNDMAIEETFSGNVVLLHSDSRHTEAALILAKEAKKRGILVTVDVEKDRKCKAFDELLQLADVIFTDKKQMEEILDRVNSELELDYGRAPICDFCETTITPITSPNWNFENTLKSTSFSKFIAKSIQPSRFFTVWRQEIGTQIVVTKGENGAFHVETQATDLDGRGYLHDVKSECREQSQALLVHDVQFSLRSSRCIHVAERFFCKSPVLPSVGEKDGNQKQQEPLQQLFSANYLIQTTGIIKEVHEVIDTTGAGDAFIGAYIMAYIHSDNLTALTINECLQFASWVAGRKVQGGHGARSSLPDGDNVDRSLGRDVHQLKSSLSKIIGEFTFGG